MADNNLHFLKSPSLQSKTFYPVPSIPRERPLRRATSLLLCIDTITNAGSPTDEDITKLIQYFEVWLTDKVQGYASPDDAKKSSSRIASLEKALHEEQDRNKALKVCLAKVSVKVSQDIQRTVDEPKGCNLEYFTRSLEKKYDEREELRQELRLLNKRLRETTVRNMSLNSAREELLHENKNLRQLNQQTLTRVKLLEHLCKAWGVDFHRIMREVKTQIPALADPAVYPRRF